MNPNVTDMSFFLSHPPPWRREAAVWIAAVAAGAFALSATLPDGEPGSPRALAIGIAGALTAMAVVLRGRTT